jgi:hypothetical protein
MSADTDVAAAFSELIARRRMEPISATAIAHRGKLVYVRNEHTPSEYMTFAHDKATGVSIVLMHPEPTYWKAEIELAWLTLPDDPEKLAHEIADALTAFVLRLRGAT